MVPSSDDQDSRPAPKNPFVGTSDLIARPHGFFPKTLYQLRPDRVRIALISLPEIECTPVWHRPSYLSDPGIDATAVERCIIRPKRDFTSRWRKMYLDALRCAVEDWKADIVCFNELAIPTHRGRPMKSVVDALFQQSQRRQCLVVAGTLHDERSHTNTGYVFFPGVGQYGVAFHKHVSAIAPGERISIPPERRIFYTRAFGLNIAVLICLDIADFAVVSAAVRAADKTDLIFICCYTEWMERLEKIARPASKAIGGRVIMVNYQCRGHMNCLVMDRGRPINLGRDPVKRRAGAHIWIHDLNREQFMRDKEQALMERTHEFGPETVFGAASLPVVAR